MRRPLIALTCLVALAAAGCQKQDLAKKEQKTEAKICTQLAAVGKALDQVAALKPGAVTGFSVDRKGKSLNLQVTPGQRPRPQKEPG